MTQTFREYLMERCINSTHALDDDLPDVFESWIAEQDIEDVIEWAEKWHDKEVKPLEMYYHFQEGNKSGVKHRERVMKRFNSIFGDMFMSQTPNASNKTRIAKTFKDMHGAGEGLKGQKDAPGWDFEQKLLQKEAGDL